MTSSQAASKPGYGRYVAASDAAMALVILLLGLFLAGSGSSLLHRWRSSSARQQSLSFEDQLGMIANTTGLIVITWWLMSLTIAVVSALLQRNGKTAAATATARFSPAFMRRLALAGVGLQLLAAPLANAATPPRPDPLPRPAVSAVWAPTTAGHDGLVLPLPLRELATPVPANAPGATSGPAPAPAPERVPPPERTAPSAAASPGASRPWTPPAPAVEPGSLAARQLRTERAADDGADVIVRAGDSLWSIAASRLGPLATEVDIAREWPRLYEANRTVIGGSPHLLHPGQVLRLPARE